MRSRGGCLTPRPRSAIFPVIDTASRACCRYSSRENWKTGGEGPRFVQLCGSCVKWERNYRTASSLSLALPSCGVPNRILERGDPAGGACALHARGKFQGVTRRPSPPSVRSPPSLATLSLSLSLSLSLPGPGGALSEGAARFR